MSAPLFGRSQESRTCAVATTLGLVAGVAGLWAREVNKEDGMRHGEETRTLLRRFRLAPLTKATLVVSVGARASGRSVEMVIWVRSVMPAAAEAADLLDMTRK